MVRRSRGGYSGGCVWVWVVWCDIFFFFGDVDYSWNEPDGKSWGIIGGGEYRSGFLF